MFTPDMSLREAMRLRWATSDYHIGHAKRYQGAPYRTDKELEQLVTQAGQDAVRDAIRSRREYDAGKIDGR